MQEERDGAVTVVTIDRPEVVPTGRALALEDDARRASLSDGVMLDRLQAFARGDRPTPPSAT